MLQAAVDELSKPQEVLGNWKQGSGSLRPALSTFNPRPCIFQLTGQAHLASLISSSTAGRMRAGQLAGTPVRAGARGTPRRSLAAWAKKKKQREYGSGREQFGLPPLDNAAAAGGGGEDVPKLRDYIQFGQLMGEKPAEVQRQLQLNNTAVAVEEECIELLSDWEDEEMQAYAIFEALMEQEAAGGGESATNSTLQRNKNRASISDYLQPAKKGTPAQLTAAQRKLAKNKGRSAVPLTMPSLKGLGSMIQVAASTRRGGAAFEQLATRPTRPEQKLAKPQRPGFAPPAAQAPTVLTGEDTSFLDDDTLWEDFAPTYSEFERALRGAAPVAPSRPAAAAAAAPPPLRRSPAKPASLLPKPEARGPAAEARRRAVQPSVLAAPPVRPAPPAKSVPPPPQQQPKAPKAPPPLAARPSLPQPPAAAVLAPPPTSKPPQPAGRPSPPSAPKAAAGPPAQRRPAPPSKPAERPRRPSEEAAPKPAGDRAPAAAGAAAASAAEAESPSSPLSSAQQPEASPGTAQVAQEEIAAGDQPPQQQEPATAAAQQVAPPAGAPTAPQEPVAPPPRQEPATAAPLTQPQRPSLLSSLTGAAVAATAAKALSTRSPSSKPPTQQLQPATPAAGPARGAAAAEAAQQPAVAEAAGRQPKAEQQALPRPRAPVARSAAQAAGGAAPGPERPARRAAQQRQEAVQYAKSYQESGEPVEVRVWQVNAAGVLVKGEHITGFVPMTQLSTRHGMRVLEEEARLVQLALQEQQPGEEGLSAVLDGAKVAGGQASDDPHTKLRRQAMGVLLGETLQACVIMVKEEIGQVVLSERAATSRLVQPNQAAAVAAAAVPLLGREVQVTVSSIKPFGAFVEFEIPAAAGAAAEDGSGGSSGDSSGSDSERGSGEAPGLLRGVGLVHASELSWERFSDPSEVVQEGETLGALISHVDLEKGRVFLSIRQATAHPLQETLETLLQMTATVRGLPGAAGAGSYGALPGAQPSPFGTPALFPPAGGASGSGSGGSRGAEGGPWEESLADLRPALGDMADALAFCQVLSRAPGVVKAEPGVRLQSRASSQALEVYLAKEEEGEGAGPAPIGSAAAAGVLPYRLVLRKGLSVQEVSVSAKLSREEMRQLAADTVAGLVAAGPE